MTALEWKGQAAKAFGYWKLDPIHSTEDDYLAWKGGPTSGVFVTIMKLKTGRYGVCIGTYSNARPTIGDAQFIPVAKKLCESFAQALSHLRDKGGIPIPAPSKF